jgi:hypothetical protein
MRWHETLAEPVLVTPEGPWLQSATPRPAALLPGAFNPVHGGHWGLADAARELLQSDVAFELSVRNVDKPDLEAGEVERRLALFRGRASVWLTRAARFVDKASLFPGTTFVVGADTALRLFNPRYYGDDSDAMLAALGELRERCCRFLVGARRAGDGELVTCADLACPAGFEDLLCAIPVERFCLDISSTELRRRGA